MSFDATRIQALVLGRKTDWDLERFSTALAEYQRFLTLCKVNPEAKVMAPADVDELWHVHMLDSVHYTADCQRMFGGYLHHDPCIGEPDPFNTEETLGLYQTQFGEEPGPAWKAMLTCAGPGKGCGSITTGKSLAH